MNELNLITFSLSNAELVISLWWRPNKGSALSRFGGACEPHELHHLLYMTDPIDIPKESRLGGRSLIFRHLCEAKKGLEGTPLSTR